MALMHSVLVVALLCSVILGFDKDRAIRASWLSKAAHCDDPSLRSWTCFACRGPHLSNVTILQNSSHDFRVFVGYDAENNEIVIAHRGSSNLKNWIADFEFWLVKYADCPDCKVHKGFWDTYHDVAAGILAQVGALHQQFPTATVFITGHSMGGAISIHTAIDIAKKVGIRNITLYSLGQPRMGNPQFIAYASTFLPLGRHFRIVHSHDPVPHLPPKGWDYQHLPTEVWYNNDGNSTYRLCTDSIRADDKSCSDSIIPYGFWDHAKYVGVCHDGCRCPNE